MSLISSKTFIPGTGIKLGNPGSAYTAMQSVTVAISGNSTMPAGDWWVLTTANVSVQVSTDGGTTWSDVYAAAQGGFIRSDGANVRLHNASATLTETVDYFGPA